jgi:magnesium chelatase subunit I
MKAAVAKLNGANGAIPDGEERPVVTASAVEFILEGLHLSRKLNKDRSAGRARYRK